MNLSRFIKYLLAYRKRHDLTQAQLGKIIHASQSQVSRWESGWNEPLEIRKKQILNQLKK